MCGTIHRLEFILKQKINVISAITHSAHIYSHLSNSLQQSRSGIWLLNLPNNKILILTKLKEFADNKFNAVKMMICVLDRIEKIVGRGENAGNQHFLHFQQCVQKLFLSVSLKLEIVWQRVK